MKYRAERGRCRVFGIIVIGVIVLFPCAVRQGMAGDVSQPRYLVDVDLPSRDTVRSLGEAGFDIAGVNMSERTACLVVSVAELSRVDDMGLMYSIRGGPEHEAESADLSKYTDPGEMAAFLNKVVSDHRGLAQKLVLKSHLHEGQKVLAIKMTKDVKKPNTRPYFLLDGQTHAREVMGAEICRDMIEYLTDGYPADPDVRRWLENINILVVPIVNPDGAQYFFDHEESYWRKNRRPGCAVDINRNFPFMWNGCQGSSSECEAEDNRGAAAKSEPETQAMVKAVEHYRPTFSLTYHSFGEMILYPYGCTDPNERALMHDLAKQLNSKLENDRGKTGKYAYGPIHSVIYNADGGSVDTCYGQYGTFGYGIEVNGWSFMPDYDNWRDVTVQRQRAAWQFFLNKTLDGPQIRGRVTSGADGKPLKATISLDEVRFTNGESPRRADARGLYQWPVKGGKTYHLNVSMQGHRTESRTVQVGSGPAVVDIVMTTSSTKKGD